MFEHSVKVPRPYKLAANIFKKVATEGGSVKSLLYDNKLRHFRTNALYALVTETIKHSSLIDKLFENYKVLVEQPRLDPWLAKVLTAELLFGKKALPGKSKPEITISSYREQFETYTADHKDDIKTEAVRRPRYVRINTNLLTTSDAIRAFQDEGFRFIRCTSGSYDDYLKQIQELTEYDFTQDYHVKTVYVFPPGTRWHEHELYLQNQIILQDKATTMAVHLLAPPQGSVVLDMCAAPGMKTTQLAAYLRNEGKIYAVERNENRYKTLCEFVEKTGSKCVQTIHKDALEIKRGDFDDVEYILLDPSCSGSGMDFSVHDYIEATRLAKLTSLQEKFLKHAMNSFPNAKRIVYSTCSVYPEENERVVTNTVKVSRAKWRVLDVKELLKGQWNNFGSNMYGSIGVRCLYAKPNADLTTGFFMAVLDRDQKDMEKSHVAEETSGENNGVVNDVEGVREKRKKKKAKSNEQEVEDGRDEENVEKSVNNMSSKHGDSESKEKRKKKKKSKRGDEVADQENTEVENAADIENSDEKSSKKKKKKSVVVDSLVDKVSEDILENSIGAEENRHKKKKKRKKDVDREVETENNEVTLEETETTSKKRKKKALSHETVEVTSETPSEVVQKRKKSS